MMVSGWRVGRGARARVAAAGVTYQLASGGVDLEDEGWVGVRVWMRMWVGGGEGCSVCVCVSCHSVEWWRAPVLSVLI